MIIMLLVVVLALICLISDINDSWKETKWRKDNDIFDDDDENFRW